VSTELEDPVVEGVGGWCSCASCRSESPSDLAAVSTRSDEGCIHLQGMPAAEKRALAELDTSD